MSSWIQCGHLYLASAGRVLFTVQRAFDGWLALDLAGAVTDAIDARLEVRHGGPRHPSRLFALHADLREAAAGRALAVRGPAADFAFGGDFLRILRRAQHEARPRLRLLRGLTVLDERSAEVLPGLPAEPELVFELPPVLLATALRERLSSRVQLAASGADAVQPRTPAASAVQPTSRSGTRSRRGAAPDSARVRTGSAAGAA